MDTNNTGQQTMDDILDQREAALIERERAAEQKMLRAEARSALDQKGLPAEALDLLDYTDKEACDKSMEALEKLMGASAQKAAEKFLRGGAPIKKAPEEGPESAIRQAFGLR